MVPEVAYDVASGIILSDSPGLCGFLRGSLFASHGGDVPVTLMTHMHPPCLDSACGSLLVGREHPDTRLGLTLLTVSCLFPCPASAAVALLFGDCFARMDPGLAFSWEGGGVLVSVMGKEDPWSSCGIQGR